MRSPGSPIHPHTLLWDGETLWVNWLGSHYLGYRSTNPTEFEAAIQRLAREYGESGAAMP